MEGEADKEQNHVYASPFPAGGRGEEGCSLTIPFIAVDIEGHTEMPIKERDGMTGLVSRKRVERGSLDKRAAAVQTVAVAGISLCPKTQDQRKGNYIFWESIRARKVGSF